MMGKIAVRIVSDGANTSGGRVDSEMLRLFKADVVIVGSGIAATEVSGGILPITQAEYDLTVA